jgi:hypothetical protein
VLITGLLIAAFLLAVLVVSRLLPFFYRPKRAVGLRVDRPTNGQPATDIFFRAEKIDPDIQAKIAEVRELLATLTIPTR